MRSVSSKAPPQTEWVITKLPDRTNPVTLRLSVNTDAVGVVRIIEDGLRFFGVELERDDGPEAA